MFSNLNYLSKQKQALLILFFVSISLILRILLSSLTLGGGDAINAYTFHVWGYNQYDIYSLFHITDGVGNPPPYFPFTKFIWNFCGLLSDFFNLSFFFTLKMIGTIFDLLTGIIILNYLKKKNIKNYFFIFLLYIFNPLSLYITTMLGFLDAIVIFLLTACCYLYDQKGKDYDLIAILLTLSFITKPYTLCFFPFFFLNCPKKTRFLLISIFTGLFLNSFYFNPENLNSIIKLLEYIFTKIKTGHQLSSHGFGLLASTIDYQNLNFPIIKISKSIAIILLLILNLFFIKKIHSIKFIFFTFFILYIFMPNIHWQYFYWIVPFIFLYKFNFNSLLFCFCFFFLAFIFSIKTATTGQEANSGLFIFGFLNNFVSGEILDLKIGLKESVFLIFLFYFCLFVNFKTKLKVIFKFLKRKKINLNLFKTIFQSNYFIQVRYFKNYIFFILFLTFFVSNFFELYKAKNTININDKNINKIVNNIKNPSYFFNFNKYGSPIMINLDLSFNKIKNNNSSNRNQLKISIDSNAFYTLRVNEKNIYDGYGLSFAENLFENRKFKIIPKVNTHIIDYSENDVLKLSISYNYFSLKKNLPFKLYFQDSEKKINWNDSKFICYDNMHKEFCSSKKIDNIIETSFKIKKNKNLLKNSTMIFLFFMFFMLINLCCFYFYKNKFIFKK